MNLKDRARQYNRFVQMFAQTIDDESKAALIPDIYPAWEPMRIYSTDEYVSYGIGSDGKTQVYRCVQGHLSQQGWKPDTEAALWKCIGYDLGIEIWSQPLGSHDAYSAGDKVSHNGVIYVSSVNGNVWEPGVYGWEVAAS